METANKFEVNTFSVPRGTIAVTIDAAHGNSDLHQILYEYKRMFFLMTGKSVRKAIVLVGTDVSRITFDSLRLREKGIHLGVPNFQELRLFDIEWSIEVNRNPTYSNHIVILDTLVT
jgi:hypothetical protein